MLKWPKRASSAIRKLFEPLQDIDVYVEDAGDEAFYRCLFRYATKGEVSIARVFALGGRDKVLSAAGAHDHKARRALFVIDGDLHWVKSRVRPEVHGVHCHEAYCVENLLLCEMALVTIIAQDKAILDSDAKNQLGYEAWKERVRQPLSELFASFAAAHDFVPSVPTVSRGVGTIVSEDATTKFAALDLAKVEQLKTIVLDAASLIASRETVDARYTEILRSIADLEDAIKAVSGKDFLLPLISFHLNSIGCKIQRKSLRMRLAAAGDVRRFEKLNNALRSAAAGEFAH